MAVAQHAELVIVCSVMLVLPILFVLLRLRSRILKGLPLVSHEHIVSFQAQFISQTVDVLAEGMTKLSLLLLYRRIFVQLLFRRINDIFIAICALWSVDVAVASIFTCLPVNTYWLIPVSFATPGKCADFQAFYLGIAIIDFVTVVMILAMPIPCVLKLQLPLRSRLGICFIFLLRTFVLAVSAVCIQNFAVTNHQTGSSEGPLDLSYLVTRVYLWFAVQTVVGIICACLLTFIPLFDSSLKGSLACYVPKSLSLSSLTNRTQSFASKRSANIAVGGTGEPNDRDKPQRRFVHFWEDSRLLGDSTWQAEEVPLELRASTSQEPQNGIIVNQEVHVSSKTYER